VLAFGAKGREVYLFRLATNLGPVLDASILVDLHDARVERVVAILFAVRYPVLGAGIEVKEVGLLSAAE
jgi:hypothetical protein